jgi:hypothetical protein
LEHFDVWVKMTAGVPLASIKWKGITLSPRQVLSLPVHSVWIHEKEKANPNWPTVLSSLRRVREIPATPRTLRARAIGAEITVLSQPLQSLSAAEDLAHASLNEDDWESEQRYLIAESLGRQQLFFGKTAIALATLEAALDSASRTSNLEAIELATTLRAAAVAAVRLQLANAGDFSRKAVRTVREDSSLPEMELIRNLGEAALVAYLGRDLPSCYGYLREAAERYLANSAPDQLGYIPYALGQVMEHVYYVATTGTPPDPAKLGVPFGEPQPDIFYRSEPTVAIPSEGRLITCIRLASIAESLERDDESIEWALRACAEAYENPSENASRWVFIALQYVAAAEREGALDIFCRELSAVASVADDRYQQALLIVLLFWILRLARDSENNRDTAITDATRLVTQCRTFAPATPHEASWLKAAELVSHAVRGGSVRSIAQTSNELFAEGNNVMGLVARTAALLAEDLDPTSALRLQMAVLEGYESAGTSLVFTKRVIRRYLEDYWGRVSARQGFLLAQPRALREGISYAAGLA